MAKYVLLYIGGGMPETEEETAAVMKAWEVWYGKLGASVVDPGNPFTPAAKSVSSDGKIGDGPAGTMASGYTILEAGSLDEAAKMAQSCPVLAGGAQISIFETFEVM
jgi:hypothetical protein